MARQQRNRMYYIEATLALSYLIWANGKFYWKVHLTLNYQCHSPNVSFQCDLETHSCLNYISSNFLYECCSLLVTEVLTEANVSSISGKHRTVRYVKEATVLTEVTNPTTLEKSLIMVPLLCIILAHLILIQVGVFDNYQRSVRIVQ